MAGGVTGGGLVDFNEGCILEGNECAGRGGGFYLGSKSLGKFELTRFLGNSALFDGGAVFLEDNASCVLSECLVTYNNSARSYAGGIRAMEQSWLDLVHCSIVGNFAPRKRSGLYLDPNSVVNIRDSILWRNAGGSVEANGATVNIGTSLSEDGADPNNGVICCDPKYAGWDGLEKIYVDSSALYPGAGTLDNPYYDLQVALDDFDFSLAEDSPCVNAASDGGNMGSGTGVGGTAGNVTAKLNILNGTYDIRGRNIAFIDGIEGIDPNTSVIRHAVLGCTENAGVTNLRITGEEIFGGITVRSDVNFVDCNVSDNTALADGGGIYIADGNCAVMNSLVLRNVCPSGKGGGGLYLDDGTESLIELSRVSENKAGCGGGMYVLGYMTAKACEILGNRADRSPSDAGALFIGSTADVSITDSDISSNYAGDTSGGIACLGKAYISNCLFQTNKAGYAAALQVQEPGSTVCENCRFIANNATQNGGALRCWTNTAPLFIDCNFVENNAKYGGAAVCWDKSNAKFHGCLFQGNYARVSYGGSFYLNQTGTQFYDCVFTGSSAKLDGGVAYIYRADSSLFENCRIEDSISNNRGGSFYIKDTAQTVFSKVEIINSRTTNYGGGIAIAGSARGLFFDSRISSCEAIYGGGIYAAETSVSNFQQCKFLNNQAYDVTLSADGGGSYFTEQAHGSFIRCRFMGNYAQDDGGGMAVAENAQVDLHNTLFTGNTGMQGAGGAHFTFESMGTFTNCTIVSNEAAHSEGGGIYLEDKSTVSVDSSIICNNQPDGIRPDAVPNVNYSCTQKLWPGLGNLMCEDSCMLDPNTFELQDGSLCIDSGNPDPNMNDGCQPPGKETLRNDMGVTGGPDNCVTAPDTQFNFSTFDDPVSLVLRGSAIFSGGILRLTKAESWKVGSAWYPLPVYVGAGFTAVFDFRIDRDGRDGMAFVIQNAGLAALGSNAAYIGYNIPNSVAVEFDTYKNGTYGDTNANHVSIQTRGNQTNSPNHEYSRAYNDSIPFLSDNQVHTAKVIYVPGELSVFVDDMETPAMIASIELENELSLMEGRAYIGFTSSTRGGLVETHDILRWSFAPTVPQ